jgi:hypothetical protein
MAPRTSEYSGSAPCTHPWWEEDGARAVVGCMPVREKPPALDPETALGALLDTPAEPEAFPPTRLTIHRTSDEDCGDRQVIFSLDGDRIAELLYGQTVTLEIAPGTHRLRANNTLVWQTVEFLAPAGAHVHFTCINWAPSWLYFFVGIFGVGPLFVTLKPGQPQFVRRRR